MFRSAALGLAAGLALLVSGASAATLTYNGPSTGVTGNTVRVTQAPVTIAGGGATPRDLSAYGFRMTEASLGEFLAWCLDLTNYLQTPTGSYSQTNAPFSQWTVAQDRIQRMFDANFAGLDATNRVQAAAFQLALWEALYDSDFDLTTGVFRGQGLLGTQSSAVDAAAAGYLAAASGYAGSRQYNLTYWQGLENTQGRQTQSLVSVVPVPLPAGALLLITALGAVAAVRRRS